MKSACAITRNTRAVSSTVRVSGPTVSSDGQSGRMFSTDTEACVGRIPDNPQKVEGRRIEPPASEPSAAKLARAAPEAPEPDDDPPVMRCGSQGLRQCP